MSLSTAASIVAIFALSCAPHRPARWCRHLLMMTGGAFMAGAAAASRDLSRMMLGLDA